MCVFFSFSCFVVAAAKGLGKQHNETEDKTLTKHLQKTWFSRVWEHCGGEVWQMKNQRNKTNNKQTKFLIKSFFVLLL